MAQSNNAVDQLIERLEPYNIPILRLGSQASSSIAKSKTMLGTIDSMKKFIKSSISGLLEIFQSESEFHSILLDVKEISNNGSNPITYRQMNQKLYNYLHSIFFQEYKKVEYIVNAKEFKLSYEHEENLFKFYYSVGMIESTPTDMIKTLKKYDMILSMIFII